LYFNSIDVAALVSAVGDAALGPEHDMAVAALRQYKDDRDEEALNNHLKDLSAAFRGFVLEQLSGQSEVHEQEKVRSNSMSERIRSLRSKLNATEAVVLINSMYYSSIRIVHKEGTNSKGP
jgi:hypothetical protein